MNLIKEIEQLRASQGLSKTAMADRFGVIYQNYNNWVARASLPKEHYEKALMMLSSREAQRDDVQALLEASTTEELKEILEDLNQLSDEQVLTVKAMVKGLLPHSPK